MITNLKKVIDFMTTANQPVVEDPAIPNEKRVKLRLDLIKEELKELEEAIEQKNLTEIMDAFCDLEYVLLGAIVEFGMKDCFQENFNEVHDSNMSKFDITLEDATLTREKYQNEVVQKYVNGLYVTFRKEDMKVLKSHSYKPANISVY